MYVCVSLFLSWVCVGLFGACVYVCMCLQSVSVCVYEFSSILRVCVSVWCRVYVCISLQSVSVCVYEFSPILGVCLSVSVLGVCVYGCMCVLVYFYFGTTTTYSCNVFRCVAVCFGVLQCVSVCCSRVLLCNRTVCVLCVCVILAARG